MLFNIILGALEAMLSKIKDLNVFLAIDKKLNSSKKTVVLKKGKRLIYVSGKK